MLAVASGFEAEEVEGMVSPGGDTVLFASRFFFQVHGSQARFEGHLIQLLGSVPHALILKCVMQALFCF